MMPWEAFLQWVIVALLFIGLGVLIVMYLNGYWSLEQRKARWNRTHFTQWK